MLNAAPSAVDDSLEHSHPGIVTPAHPTEPMLLQCVLQTPCCRLCVFLLAQLLHASFHLLVHRFSPYILHSKVCMCIYATNKIE